jgi:hypothetical protein
LSVKTSGKDKKMTVEQANDGSRFEAQWFYLCWRSHVWGLDAFRVDDCMICGGRLICTDYEDVEHKAIMVPLDAVEDDTIPQCLSCIKKTLRAEYANKPEWQRAAIGVIEYEYDAFLRGQKR